MSDFFTLWQQNPTGFAIAFCIFGLLIGSFLNVVIYRTPLMMFRAWHQAASEHLEEHPNAPELPEQFSLAKPNSTCPKCKNEIRPSENIPVISYLLQAGKCRHCQCKISARYPFIETLTGLCALAAAIHFGPSIQAVAAFGFMACLIAMSLIDIDHTILPDEMTLSLLWIGLALNINSYFVPLQDAVIGAMAGYTSLWLTNALFMLVRKKQGMGHGDFKLLAALGAWLGWQTLPMIILLSSVIGLVAAVLLMAVKKHQYAKPLPFGPYLAIAGIVALFAPMAL